MHAPAILDINTHGAISDTVDHFARDAVDRRVDTHDRYARSYLRYGRRRYRTDVARTAVGIDTHGATSETVDLGMIDTRDLGESFR